MGWLIVIGLVVLVFVVALVYVRCLDNTPPDYDGEDLFTLDDDQRDA